MKINSFFQHGHTYFTCLTEIINDKHYATPVLSICPPSFPCAAISLIPACCFTIKPGRTTRPTTYETSDTGQQVILLAPCLSDPTIHLAVLYIICNIYIFFCHHPTSHPSILAFPLSFALVCYNGLL